MPLHPYELLFADQELEEIIADIALPPGSPLHTARAHIWAGRNDEAMEIAGREWDHQWSGLFVALARIRGGMDGRRTLLSLARDGTKEPRIRLWAWTALRGLGEPIPDAFAALLGVVVEVPMEGGKLDVLATYADATIRLLGHAGHVVIRDPADPVSPDQEARALLKQGMSLLSIPPAPRDRNPPKDKVRMTGLSPMGIHAVDLPWSEIEPPAPHAALFRAAADVLKLVTKQLG